MKSCERRVTEEWAETRDVLSSELSSAAVSVSDKSGFGYRSAVSHAVGLSLMLSYWSAEYGWR